MDHEAFEGMMISDNSSYIAVVAIDFGTTYSGFAFAFNHKEGEGGIHMNKAWGNEQGLSTLKTSTSLLLRPNGQFDSFGFEADEKYANFFCGEDQEYMYFKRFKMTLHKSETLDRNAKLMARNGRELKALAVFSHSIRYLKDKAIEIIREVTGDDGYNARDIQWVLTVPAIWKPAAKQFMREAAYMAGIASSNNPEQLLIALEPEAASIHCRDKKMKDFTSERGDAGVSDVFARPAAKYLVVDIGGGTLDVTAHEILTNGNIKEVFQVTGGPYGGTKVDEEFVSLLKQFFGTTVVEAFSTRYPGEWLDMMNDFEMKKRGRRAFEGGTTRLRLPRSLTALISEYRGPASSIEGVQFLRNEYLCLEAQAMKKLFKPVLGGIVKHLTNLLENRCLNDLQFFFLVGGFAQSALLQDAIRKQFSSRSLEMKESQCHENSRLSDELGRLKKRHAALAERKVNMSQRRTENIQTTNSQSDLKREYKVDFRDGSRLEAIGAIEKKFSLSKKPSTEDQLKAYRLACVIFEVSYECAEEAKDMFLSFYSSVVDTLVSEAPRIASSDQKPHKLLKLLKLSAKEVRGTPDTLDEVMVLLREQATRHNLDKLFETVEAKMESRLKENREEGMLPSYRSYEKGLKKTLEGYIKYCIQFSWRLSTQVPPIRIEYKELTYNSLYHNESQAFVPCSKTATTRNWACPQKHMEEVFYLWPILLDFDGTVVEKGDVVVKKKRIYFTTSL